LERIVWIAWEQQRRTTELARALGVPLVRELFAGPYLLRIPIVTIRTIAELLRRRPAVVIVQNPSIVLAALACFLGPVLGFRVIVDRHSNFKLETLSSTNPKHIIFHWLSRYSLRRADLTIVTNFFLAEVVTDRGGAAQILPDPIPILEPGEPSDLGPGDHVFYVSSFDHDEPLELVIEVARQLGGDVTIHVSGDFTRADPALVNTAPANVAFLGFMNEDDYVTTMASVDVVLTLTTQEHTMQCGAYEAVALGQPLVFANHEEMKRYFHKGVVVAELTVEDLTGAIREALARQDDLRREMVGLKEDLIRSWSSDFKTVERIIRRK